MTVSDGAVLGDRYQLDRLIGRGGMADVYAATDRVLDRPVAVKLLRDLTGDRSERERFSAEARTLAQLNHPSLVTVLDAGIDVERPFLVLELVDGPSLADVMPQALAHDRVARIGAQVASALAHAHSAGIVHRDVKPGNVLLGRDERARLTDFGIARLLTDAARHTKTGMTIGTAAYLAPEQLRGDEITPAADVYSLGLVLLEALTGERVYQGGPTEAALARLHTSPAVPQNLPSDWRQTLTAMTGLEPRDRPTALEVAATFGAAEGPSEASPAGDTRVLVGGDPAGGEKTTHVLRQPGSRRPQFTRLAAAALDGLHRWTRKLPGFATAPRWASSAVVISAVVAVLLLTVGLLALRVDSGPGTRANVPGQVPLRLREPLADLRDAIHGEE